MLLKSEPLRLGELHPLPVVITRFVLPTELHTPRFARRRFARRDMCLKFYGVGARFRGRVDIRMVHAQTSVMRLRDFGDDETGIAHDAASVRVGGVDLEACNVSPPIEPSLDCSMSCGGRAPCNIV